nr:helix-turn-helix domain-containing protein [Arthrobacter ramosus]
MVQARLSAKVRVQTQTMGQTLSRLEAHGHITRERSRLDGRSQRVAVSGFGGLRAQHRRPTTRLPAAAVASLPWQPPGSRRRRPVPIAPPTGRRVRPR